MSIRKSDKQLTTCDLCGASWRTQKGFDSHSCRYPSEWAWGIEKPVEAEGLKEVKHPARWAWRKKVKHD